ncbi:hypothetical protein NIES3974_30480 [Calothrix sp. NIES-3974]|nr:hypothetical protein NIES3974_30480 [Calothrix sp. NIES-3974]
MWKGFRNLMKDDNFTRLLGSLEVLIAKVLAVMMVGIIIYATGDLIVFIFREVFTTQYGTFYQKLFKLFGLFLNLLIALEILENITGYLKKHVIQVELVITTSLIAVARKIIILDLGKTEGMKITGLAIAILALSISYLIIHSNNAKHSS